jgi:UDP-N-acetylglucosamine transferase subunit ALG13
MILVTVGTTIPFDSLIKKVDQLCQDGTITEPVLCQIGKGQYEPSHCQFLRFLPNLNNEIDSASLVIGHGGTGTTLDLIQRKKPFIGVANPLADDAHQEHFLRRLAKDIDILWTKDLERLAPLLQQAQQADFAPSSLPSLAHELTDFIDTLPDHNDGFTDTRRNG